MRRHLAEIGGSIHASHSSHRQLSFAGFPSTGLPEYRFAGDLGHILPSPDLIGISILS
jgi:hypothetical protein